jgi:hypothetical protein
VRIALVPDVPDQLVAWRVEHGVQSDRQLDHAQPGADVATGPGAHVDESRTDLVRQRAELVAGEGLEVGRRREAIEQAHGRRGLGTNGWDGAA